MSTLTSTLAEPAAYRPIGTIDLESRRGNSPAIRLPSFRVAAACAAVVLLILASLHMAPATDRAASNSVGFPALHEVVAPVSAPKAVAASSLAAPAGAAASAPRLNEEFACSIAPVACVGSLRQPGLVARSCTIGRAVACACGARAEVLDSEVTGVVKSTALVDGKCMCSFGASRGSPAITWSMRMQCV